jgi:TRAP-type C4-dicarboxylate transport system permease small subunit
MESRNRKHSRVLTLLINAAKLSVVMISVVMIAVTLAQVVFRYVIAAPLPWSEELARYCFVWIVFLGGAIGLSRGVHLGVDLLVNAMPAPVRRGIDILTNVLIAAFAATVIYASLPVLNMNVFQRSPALGVPMTYIYMAIPISMGLIFLICAERVLQFLFSRPAQAD